MANRPFHIDMAAPEYLRVLARLHQVLAPKTYLEIGTRNGDSLKLASCTSIAIDPQFEISADVLGKKPICHFYQTTSDQFFRKYNAETVLGSPVDFAYLDGMHLAEFLLRDFMNVEKWMCRNSVVVMHDCLPSDIYMTCRNEGDHVARARSVAPSWWTGDVWKAVWALTRFRPDVNIVAIDSPPTGLICLTNLNPSSRFLDENYFSIVEEMAELGHSADRLQEFIGGLKIVKPSQVSNFEDIARFFYI